MKNKSIILLIVIAISILALSCNKNDINDTAVPLLKNIYEVSNYEAYESVLKGRKDFISNEIINPDGTGMVSLDFNNAKDIYRPYINEYSPYTTEKGLGSIFAQGIATYMDELAYTNEFLTKVDDIKIKERKTGPEKYEYNYTVKLKFIKGDKTISGEASGILGFKKLKTTVIRLIL